MRIFVLLALAGLPAAVFAADPADVVEPAQFPVAAARTVPAGELIAPELAPALLVLPETRLPAGGEATHGHTAEYQELGYVEPFDAKWLPQWPWQARADGSAVARVEIHSRAARGLRLQLANLARGLQLRLYDPNGTAVFGPFERPQRSADGTWWAPTIFGDTLGLELHVAADQVGAIPEPEILAVAYLTCDCAFNPGSPMACHNDVSCFQSWKDAEAQAVARITFISGGGCGACSGGLLNRGPGDGCPLFMTANHCVSTAAEADTVEFFWFFETPSCNGTPPNPNNVPRTLGSLICKRRSGADFTLLGCYDPPASGYRLGWSASDWGSGGSATGVHHPRATFKRISFGTSDGSTTGTFCDQNGENCFDADVFAVEYTNGTTEPGSSGSPIFDGGRYVRGTLTGGPSGCPTTTKYYGRFDLAYNQTRYFLGDAYIASPVYVNGGSPGDPGNNGSAFEHGTVALPFNTVYEATFAVRTGDVVRIVPGTYNETFTLWRPMWLENNGGGVVTIGQ